MKVRSLLQRITAIALLLVFCLQPVEFALANFDTGIEEGEMPQEPAGEDPNGEGDDAADPADQPDAPDPTDQPDAPDPADQPDTFDPADQPDVPVTQPGSELSGGQDPAADTDVIQQMGEAAAIADTITYITDPGRISVGADANGYFDMYASADPMGVSAWVDVLVRFVWLQRDGIQLKTPDITVSGAPDGATGCYVYFYDLSEATNPTVSSSELYLLEGEDSVSFGVPFTAAHLNSYPVGIRLEWMEDGSSAASMPMFSEQFIVNLYNSLNVIKEDSFFRASAAEGLDISVKMDAGFDGAACLDIEADMDKLTAADGWYSAGSFYALGQYQESSCTVDITAYSAGGQQLYKKSVEAEGIIVDAISRWQFEIPFTEAVMEDGAYIELVLNYLNSTGDLYTGYIGYAKVSAAEDRQPQQPEDTFDQPVPIKDEQRVSLSAEYAASSVETDAEGNVFLDLQVDTSDMTTVASSGYYSIHPITVTAPNEMAVDCYISMDWVKDGEKIEHIDFESPNEVYAGRSSYILAELFFNSRITVSDSSANSVMMIFNWRDADGNTVALESLCCVITDANTETLPDPDDSDEPQIKDIDDKWRFALEALEDPDGRLEGSSIRTDSEGKVYIDIKAQLGAMHHDQGTYWMYGVLVTVPDEEKTAYCNYRAVGVTPGGREDELAAWMEIYAENAGQASFVPINIPFREEYTRIDLYIDWCDSEGNVFALEKAYAVVTETEVRVPGEYIKDKTRFSAEDGDHMTAFVDAYPDGVVCLGVNAATRELSKDKKGFFRTPVFTVTAPKNAAYGEVEFSGGRGSEEIFNLHETVSVDKKSLKADFTVPFTRDIVRGGSNYGAVSITFTWMDKKGNSILRETAYCEVNELASYISDPGRFVLNELGEEFLGTRITTTPRGGDAACILISAHLAKLVPDDNGVYHLLAAELTAPEGAAACEPTYRCNDGNGRDSVFGHNAANVENGRVQLRIPFTEDAAVNANSYTEMEFLWLDENGVPLSLERAYCEFEYFTSPIRDDIYRYELVNSIYLNGSALEGSEAKLNSSGEVYLNLYAAMDSAYKTNDGYYWIDDVILTAPDYSAISCDVTARGIDDRGNEVFRLEWKDRWVDRRENDLAFMGMSVPYNAATMAKTGSYAKVELIFTWYDENHNEIITESSYAEIRKPSPDNPRSFADIPGVPAEFIEVDIPESLKDSIKAEISDGRVKLTVGQATAEQWAEAYLNSFTDTPTIVINMRVLSPEGTRSVFDVQGDMEFSSYMRQTDDNTNGVWRSGDVSSNGLVVAQVVESSLGYTFIPMNMDGGRTRYIAWCDKPLGEAGGNITRAILDMEIELEPGIDVVEAGKDIIPDAVPLPGDRLTYDVNPYFDAAYDETSGVLTYTFKGTADDFDDLKAAVAGYEINGWLTFRMTAPEGYDTVKVNGITLENSQLDRWSTFCTYENGGWQLAFRPVTETVMWSSSTDPSLPFIRETVTARFDLSGLTWMDKYWTPIPAERIKVPTVEGLTFTVQDGGVHTAFTGELAPDINKLRDIEAAIEVPVIDGVPAKGFRFNHMGGSATIDYADFMAEEQLGLMETSIVGRQGDARRSLLNAKELKVDGVSILFNEVLGGEDVTLLDWYDNAACEGEPILREYVWQTEDQLYFLSDGDTVESEEDITEPVKRPTLVSKGGWKLKLHRYPQKNGNKNHAYYFRLEVKGDGAANEKWTVYLPFEFLGTGVDTLEEAMSKVNGNKKITINHYNEAHDIMETIEGKITRNGIKFSSKGFSPLMVTVAAASAPEAMDYVTVTFNPTGGEFVEPLTDIVAGSTAALPTPVREGHEFAGWYTEKNGEGELYTDETTVLESVTLYADWKLSTLSAPTASLGDGMAVDLGTEVYLAGGSGADVYYKLNQADWKLYTGSAIVLDEVSIADFDENVFGWQLLTYAESAVYGKSAQAEYTYTLAVEQQENQIVDGDLPHGADIPEGIWHSPVESFEYDGTAKTPVIRLYDGGRLLAEKTDYTLAYKNNKNAGHASAEDEKKTPHAVVTMKGNYSGKMNIFFTIEPVELTKEDFTVSIPAQTESGKALTPKPVVTWNRTGKAIKLKTDYVMEYGQCILPGEYTVAFIGTGNFAGTLEAGFTVADKLAEVLMSKTTVASIPAASWTGTPIEPELLVTYKAEPKDANGKNSLTAGVDYTVEFVGNNKAGTATAIITGTGEDGDGDGTVYVGSVSKTFKIEGINLSNVTVNNVSKGGYVYTGSEIRPTEFADAPMDLTYQADKKKPETWMQLEENVHYTVEYQKNIAKGTATVIFTGIPEGGCTGSKKQTFKINADLLTAETTQLEIAPCAYAAGGAVPRVTVTQNGTVLTEGVDYTLSYKNNKALYTDTTFADTKKAPSVTVKGKGNFGGSLTEYFTIEQRQLTHNCGVVISAADKVDTGKAGGWQQTFKVLEANGKALAAGKEYNKNAVYTLIAIPDSNGVLLETERVLTKKDTVPAGSVIRITVEGMGGYSGEVSAVYRILEKGMDIKSATITVREQQYTGREIRLTNMAQFDGAKTFIKVGKETKPLVLGRDFRVVEGSYQKNIAQGSAKVTLEGIGQYGGQKSITFKIAQRPAWLTR